MVTVWSSVPRSLPVDIGHIGRCEQRAGRVTLGSMERTPARVLFVYFTYSEQARRVAKAMTETLVAEGCEVTEAVIEFTDARYASRFAAFPMRHAFLDVLRMLPAQLRRATGEIDVPEAAAAGDYDLVVVGSPTWWLTTSMPIRSYLESTEGHAVLDGRRFASYVVCRRYWGNNEKTVKRLGTKAGGSYVDGLHFAYEGGQVRSLLSLVSYLGSGENRPRYLGVKIPPTNLKPDFADAATTFARKLAASVGQTSE
jgi:hypothetical protein